VCVGSYGCMSLHIVAAYDGCCMIRLLCVFHSYSCFVVACKCVLYNCVCVVSSGCPYLVLYMYMCSSK